MRRLKRILLVALFLALAPATAWIFWLPLAQAITYSQPIAINPSTTPLVASTQVAAGACVATLTGAANKFTYLEGFTVTASGATSAIQVNITITGSGTTLNYAYAAPASATTACTTLDIRFPTPIPSSAVNTNFVVTLPTLGAGNTQASVTAYGFLQ